MTDQSDSHCSDIGFFRDVGSIAAGTTLKGDVNRDGDVTEIQRIAAEFGSEKYSLDIIRNYVAGIDEPVELTDGTKRLMINFDNAATPLTASTSLPPRLSRARTTSF